MSNVLPIAKASFNPVAELSYTLPAAYYYDKDVYEREKEEIWFKTWQYVCSTGEVAEPGSFFTAMILDQPVVVTRDREGKLRAFYNVCKHRGHMLVEGSGCSRTLRCPFHAWTYSAEGKLLSAPNAENIAGFDFDDFGLSEIRLETIRRHPWNISRKACSRKSVRSSRTSMTSSWRVRTVSTSTPIGSSSWTGWNAITARTSTPTSWGRKIPT